MNDEPEAPSTAPLPPLPLEPDAARRIQARVRREVDARRQELLEGALYGGFALAAVAWTLLILLPR